MTEPMTDLFGEIRGINYAADENDLKGILQAWSTRANSVGVRESLRRWLEDYADLTELTALARETATHYVWPLFSGSNGYSLVINEFKDPDDMMSGYATTLHNHRYSFASFVLSGGYRQTRSAISFWRQGRVRQIWDVGQDTVTEGAIVTASYAEFHRLTIIQPRTVTLLVKCPAVRVDSISVDAQTLKVTRHLPVEARVNQLKDTLALPSEQRR